MIKVSILLALVGVAVCSYPGAYGPYRYGLAKPYRRAYAPAPVKVVKVETDETPKPFQFAYDVTDEEGNVQARQESGDENGVVKGTYGYKTSDGIWRQVEYIADESGFKAHVKTNEPGTDNQNPADVIVESGAAVVEEKTAEEVKPEDVIAVKPAIGHGYRAPYYGNYAYGRGLYRDHRRGPILSIHKGHGYGQYSPIHRYGLGHGYRQYSPIHRYGLGHGYGQYSPTHRYGLGHGYGHYGRYGYSSPIGSGLLHPIKVAKKEAKEE